MTCNAGDTICNCTLLQKCGDGAYGEVWLARDTIGANVALKIIKNGGRYSERELAGLKNYKDCNHPNLLKIRYVEITDAQIICIMDAADDLNHGNNEYQPDTLANRLRKYGRLDGKEITDMLDGLLSGLEELHKNGLVHRDIKPDNILWVNGRATLADVGLIAFEGAGSLVGTPGFLSPRVLEGNPAETSDDFYALGKVIYCALTGLAVTEYPSLPIDVTISMDANLNKALRESCTHPVKSTAEFRSLLTTKVKNEKKQFQIKKYILIIFSVILISGVVFLLCERQNIAQKVIPATVPSNIETVMTETVAAHPVDVKNKVVNDAVAEAVVVKASASKELCDTVYAFLERKGYFSDNGKHLLKLLQYQTMTGYDWRRSVQSRSTSGMTHAESGLFSLLVSYFTDFDEKTVKAHQDYWRKKSGSPEQILKEMLKNDTLMQAVALDFEIRLLINIALKRKKILLEEKNELQFLIKYREYLLNPRTYKKKMGDYRNKKR